MKYWDELRNLENDIIQLDTMNSLVAILSESIEVSSTSDVRNSLWHVQEILQKINQSMSENFQTLFAVVREDSLDKDEESEYNFDELTEVVNSWVK